MNDAEMFRFIADNKIACGIRENGYWFAHGDRWVSRKTLAECINVLALPLDSAVQILNDHQPSPPLYRYAGQFRGDSPNEQRNRG